MQSKHVAVMDEESIGEEPPLELRVQLVPTCGVAYDEALEIASTLRRRSLALWSGSGLRAAWTVAPDRGDPIWIDGPLESVLASWEDLPLADEADLHVLLVRPHPRSRGAMGMAQTKNEPGVPPLAVVDIDALRETDRVVVEHEIGHLLGLEHLHDEQCPTRVMALPPPYWSPGVHFTSEEKARMYETHRLGGQNGGRRER